MLQVAEHFVQPAQNGLRLILVELKPLGLRLVLHIAHLELAVLLDLALLLRIGLIVFVVVGATASVLNFVPLHVLHLEELLLRPIRHLLFSSLHGVGAYVLQNLLVDLLCRLLLRRERGLGLLR